MTAWMWDGRWVLVPVQEAGLHCGAAGMQRCGLTPPTLPANLLSQGEVPEGSDVGSTSGTTGRRSKRKAATRKATTRRLQL